LSNVGIFQFLHQTQTWLVDNRYLQAKTAGLGYRLSPRLEDMDKNSSSCVAPWSSTVRGVPYGPTWLKVGDRFLPMQLDGVTVLLLQDEAEDSRELESYTWHRMDKLWPKYKDFQDYFFGDAKRHDVTVWPGSIQSERSRRLTSVLTRHGSTIVGMALAGIFAGVGLTSLRMEALKRIGEAYICASLIILPAVLGLLPVLISAGIGPTRARRRAYIDFHKWVQEGQPTGAPMNGVPSGMKESITNRSRASGAVDVDKLHCHAGIIAAEELGLPFSLTVKSLVDHLPKMTLKPSEVEDNAPVSPTVTSGAGLKRDSFQGHLHPLVNHSSLPARPLSAPANAPSQQRIRRTADMRLRWESDNPVADSGTAAPQQVER
jgi:hypothetical protein